MIRYCIEVPDDWEERSMVSSLYTTEPSSSVPTVVSVVVAQSVPPFLDTAARKSVLSVNEATD